MPDLVTLVDRDDNVVGAEEKIRAHREGKLHRAFSVFVFDEGRRLLIQRRATGKYHSGGLWSNTCCGHPRPGESADGAAGRRLTEEMGFVCDLRPAFRTIYEMSVADSMIEHELNQVFIGWFNGSPSPDTREVEACRWMDLAQLRDSIDASPERYTPWLRLLLTNRDWPAMDEILGGRNSPP
ncbi:MAG TPA: isopentenyl-diphosphate Delta-isomerase [Vicinamibacterales bacterium]|nr:isopentenyl-diphosphate Delta-isomerase [Vicinamibacterales bacterium]